MIGWGWEFDGLTGVEALHKACGIDSGKVINAVICVFDAVANAGGDVGGNGVGAVEVGKGSGREARKFHFKLKCLEELVAMVCSTCHAVMSKLVD